MLDNGQIFADWANLPRCVWGKLFLVMEKEKNFMLQPPENSWVSEDNSQFILFVEDMYF